jgi:hypothetical protein
MEATTALVEELALLPREIFFNNVLPFLELPSCTFEVEEQGKLSCSIVAVFGVEKGDGHMLMEECMRGIGRRIRNMDSGNRRFLMEEFTKVIGKMARNTGKGKRRLLWSHVRG